MIIELLIIIIIALCVLGYKNKTIYFIMASLMFILFTFTTANADYNVYHTMYDRMSFTSSISGSDIGFGFLMRFCKSIGMNYHGFLGLVFILGITIITFCLFSFSQTPTFALGVYFILFFGSHLIQIRAYLAEWIIIYALLEVIENRRFMPKRFIVYILIATLFHGTSIFFLSFLLVFFVKDRKKLYIFISLFFLLLPKLYSILSQISLFNFIKQKIAIYMADTNKSIGSRTIVFVVLVVILSLYIILLVIKENSSIKKSFIIRSKKDKGWEEKLLLLSDFNIMSWISLGMILAFSNNFFRFNRVVIIVDLIVLINYYKRKINIARLCGLFIAFPVFYIIFELFTHAWYEQITVNYLFNFLGLV